MAILNTQQLVDAELAGKTDFYTFRKAPNQTTANGIWFDLCLSPGNPVPNYYAAAPNVAIALAQSTDAGIYHGGNVQTRVAASAALGGSIVDTTFTDTTHGSGYFEVDMVLTGSGVATGTRIVSLITGTGANAGGTYKVSVAQTVTAQTITGTYATGETKVLKTFAIQTATATAVPMPVRILDYLMYYPFVDMSDTSPTGATQTTSIDLPRYPTGVGVQIMPVVVAAPTGAGNPQFYVSYRNTLDELHYTPVHACNTQIVNGTIVHSQPVGIAASLGVTGSPSPFLTLQPGDKGVKKIEAVFWLGAGDIGLVSFVLVRPLAQLNIRQTTAWIERNFYTDFTTMPEIKDDAYLNMICCPPGTLSGALITGYMQTVFG